MLVNANISLKKLTPSDQNTLFQIMSDPKLWENHTKTDQWKPEVQKSWFEKALEVGALGIYFNGELIGSTRFYQQKKDSICIGYTFISRQFWGKGINAPLKKAMINDALKQHPKVYFRVDEYNLRSIKALEKLGAKVEDRVEKDGKRTDGTERTTVVLYFDSKL